jgi:hypothetical protein
MKRWLLGLLLVALAGVVLPIVINSNRDPIAVVESLGAKIQRNEQGEVVEVDLAGATSSNTGRELFRTIGLGGDPWDGTWRVHDVDLVHLKGLTGLRELFLGLTQITDAGLVHLKGLTKLKKLVLDGTKVTSAGIAELQKSLPNCKITI